MTPYSADYLGLLIRKGRLMGYKNGLRWYTTTDDVDRYMKKAAESSYEHQQALNVKVPAAQIKTAKINFRWAMILIIVIAAFGIYIWKTIDDKNNENVINKYVISEDKNGNLTIYADDPSKVNSVKVMKKE